MSSAVFPLGMNSMPSSGYNHGSTYYNKQYITWKGTGINSNPVGIAPGHIRPLTNNDPGNVFQTGFGLPRPIKHFRKGRVIPPQPITGVPNLNGVDPYNRETAISINENALINYNMNRYVKSSKGTSLGGGFGGSGLLNELQDKPGAFIIKQNPPNEINEENQMNSDCKTCEGVGIVATYYPNKPFLQENPEPRTQTALFCCNDEYKAKRMVIYASTNLKKNYYTTTKQYLQNRCKTYEQKSFNYLSNNPYDKPYVKPGGPDSLSNTYFGNCLCPSEPSQRGCKLTVYKPNNYQYANQGAVSSSTRILKLNVDTISTNAASINNYNNTGPLLVNANELYAGVNPAQSNLYKNKAPTCNTPWPLNFSQSGRFQNKKICHYRQLPVYQVPASAPSPYRYYPGTVFNSNHFSQSPNTYNTTTGTAEYQ